MSLRIQIERRCPVKAMHPLLCRRFKLFQPTDSPDLESIFVGEEIQVAVLTHYGDVARPVIAFWPGETGHESYYLDDLASSLEQSKAEFVSTKGMFGPTRWDHQDLHMCAGSLRYNNLRCPKADVLEAINIFKTHFSSQR